MTVRANKKGSNQRKRCRSKNGSAEEKKNTIKIKLKVLPETTGYLGRQGRKLPLGQRQQELF